MLALGVGVGVGLWLWLYRTRTGMVIRAGVDDQRMTAALGINIQRTFALAFVVGSALAALGAVVWASQSNIASGQASQAGDTTSNLGYPEDSTLFYPVLLYQNGFRYFQMGYASAMAMLLLGVSLAVTLLILVNSRRFVHYAGAK